MAWSLSCHRVDSRIYALCSFRHGTQFGILHILKLTPQPIMCIIVFGRCFEEFGLKVGNERAEADA